MDDSPAVHIVVRRTLDWHDEALVRARIDPKFRPKMEAWNAAFTMPYHVFRQRLKAIADLSFSRVDGAVCSRIDEVPRGALLVPVDDDDWFAPHLASMLRQAHDQAATGYLWAPSAIQYESAVSRLRRLIGRLTGRREKFLCKTNNYAVRIEPDVVPLVLGHVRASAYFGAHPSTVKRLAARLAIQNRNLASQTTLAWQRPTIGRQELVGLLAKHRALYASWTPATGLAWAAPYVDLMKELMSEIDVKRGERTRHVR